MAFRGRSNSTISQSRVHDQGVDAVKNEIYPASKSVIFTSRAEARSWETFRCACCWEDHFPLKFCTKSQKSQKYLCLFKLSSDVRMC